MSVGWPQTFALDLDQVRKVVALYAEEPTASVQSIALRLGIGEPKVAGLNSWLKYLGLRDPKARALTAVGNLMYRADPTLTDLGTLSVLHYLLCSNPNATVWYETVNHFLAKHNSFTRDDLSNYFEREDIGRNSAKQLKSDLGLFLSTYTGAERRALEGLGFLRPKGSVIAVERVPEVHPLILGFCLFHRLESGVQETTTSTLRLLKDDGSPGRIFRLSEDDLRKKLRVLETLGFLSVVKVADIDGISYTRNKSAIELLEEYYRGLR